VARRKKNGNGGNGQHIEPTHDQVQLAHAIAHALKPAFDSLGAKIDGLGTRLETKIDDLGTKFETKIDGLGVKLDIVGTKLETKVDALILLSRK
jgi:hypothetical protein